MEIGDPQLRRRYRAAFTTSTAATLAITLASGAFGVVSTRALGPHERGLLAAAVVWTSVLSSITVVGLPQAVTYHVGRAADAAGRHASTALVLSSAGGVAIALVGAPSALVLAGDAGPAMAVLFAASPILMIGGCGIAALLGTGAFKTWGIVRFIGPGSALVALCVVVVLDGETALAVAAVTAASWALQAVVVLKVLRDRQLLARPDGGAARNLLDYGWRQLLAGVAWLLTYKLDQMVLSVAAAPAALGLYAVGATIGEVIAPVAASAGAIMLARVATGGATEARAHVGQALIYCALLAGTAAALAFLAAPQVLRGLFGEEFVPAADVLRILLPGSVALALATVLADTLRGLGLPLVPAKAEAAGAVCTAVLLALLIPPYGIRGAAIASTVSYTLVMVVLALLLRSRLRGVTSHGR